MSANSSQTQVTSTALHQKIALVIGPLVFAIMMAFDSSQTAMPTEAWRVAALALWMAVWWAGEAIPVPATAILPVVVLPLLGVSSIKAAGSHYANPIIFLFLGAFILALAVERWSLHKRIALSILQIVGTDGKRLIGGFMLVAALLSMWITNTSTTMMLMPIALSVAGVIVSSNQSLSDKQIGDFQTAMLLGVAYAATIGGLATLIGTPPNAQLAAFLSEQYSIQITFVNWMLIGVPLTFIMLPLAWWALTRISFKVDIPESPKVDTHLNDLKRELGKISTAEVRVAAVFICVVSLWILRKPINTWIGSNLLSDAAIALVAAVLLFMLPSGNKQQAKLMVWETTSKLPWGVLILFGGGLSLAAAVSQSGLANWLGESLSPLGTFGIVALIIAATALVILLTELTSNLATTATFLPVVGAVALELDVSPLLLCVPIALAASCAFMLPVATAPNAIVFASGKISIPQMIRAGAVLNIIGLVLICVIAIYIAPWVLS